MRVLRSYPPPPTPLPANAKVHVVLYIIYFLFSFHGSVQADKIHMEMEIVIFV